MALTRKMLKGMGIEEEKIDLIIDAHTESVDAIKEERDNYKVDADKLANVQKELDELKTNGGDWQKKYEKEHSDFEAYKADITKKETKTAKESAFRALLKESGVSEKRIDAIVKISDIEGLELDEGGKIKDYDARSEQIKTEYADFIETRTTKGANTATPPSNVGSGTGKTKEEILAIKDGAARRQAMAENPSLFGLN